jgi:hypothetical protein
VPGLVPVFLRLAAPESVLATLASEVSTGRLHGAGTTQPHRLRLTTVACLGPLRLLGEEQRGVALALGEVSTVVELVDGELLEC